MTGLGERVMAVDLGVNTYQYVFENLTQIQRVRLASAVANAIETFIPGTIVNSVIPGEKKYEEGRGTGIVFDVVYTVGGQARQQQVVLPPTAQGQ
jgi:phage baseplate assembly protein W